MATTLERNKTSHLRGLRCRACRVLQPADERYICGECYGPIEPEYDLATFDAEILRDEIERGPLSLWRYAPLLPVAEPRGHFKVGWTPLVEAPRLGATIGVGRLFLKDDSRNPSLSFKDRPVALALARALELGLDTLACASTGNLAGAVAAAAARNGLRALVFVPATTDEGKIAGAAAYGATVVRVNGTYDQVNRLCARLADEERWGFVNFTLRPYYAEGSKTLAFETAEQLGWEAPDHVVVPIASGSLLTKIRKGFDELFKVGLTILLVEAAAYHRQWATRYPEKYGADVLALVKRGLEVLAVDFEAALVALPRLRERARRAMEGIDALILPATAIVAPPVTAGGEVREPLSRFTRPFNTTGQPVVALPAPVPGLPVGIQVVGRTNSATIGVAATLEMEWRGSRP